MFIYFMLHTGTQIYFVQFLFMSAFNHVVTHQFVHHYRRFQYSPLHLHQRAMLLVNFVVHYRYPIVVLNTHLVLE